MTQNRDPRRAAGRRRPGGWLRGLVGLVGELMITAGAVLGLFVAWQLFWTDVVAGGEQAAAVAVLENEFASDSPTVGQAPANLKPDQLGKAFAIVRIPRFGDSYKQPVYQGIDRATLQKGIGHYSETAMPGEIGNFAMAGHRTTYGKPFNQIAELKDGDRVIVQTRDSYFVYQVIDHDIVLPSQVDVVLPVPGEPKKKPTDALLTMTSCHPEFSSRQRYIIHAKLAETLPANAGLPAELLKVEG